MTPTPGQLVYVAEYGAGARPGIVRDVFTSIERMGEVTKVGVDLTDKRGGYRTVFPISVFDNEQDAAKAAE